MIIEKKEGANSPDASMLCDNRTYVVYAMLLGEPSKFLIEDDDVFSFPFFISSDDVHIVDSKVSAYWRYSEPLVRENKHSSRPAMLGCKEMIGRFFYQRLVEGDDVVQAKWNEIKVKFDLEARQVGQGHIKV